LTLGGISSIIKGQTLFLKEILMSKWEVVATQAAIDRAAKVDASNSHRYYHHQASDKEAAELDTLVIALRKFPAEAALGNGAYFRELVDLAYPVWRDQIVHTRHPRSGLFGELVGDQSNYYGTESEEAAVLSNFFILTFNESEATVANLITRAVELINITKTLTWVRHSMYVKNFQMEDLEKLSMPKYYLPYMVVGLERGFTVEELKKIKPGFFLHNFTPSDLRSVANKHSYKTINSIVSLLSLQSVAKVPSFSEIAAALDAGFMSDKEFKAFARNTGTDYSDTKLFSKLAKIRNKVTAEEAEILGKTTSNVVDVAKILVKL
jgi:hypothetical protein